MSEVVDDTRTRRPEREHDRVPTPDGSSLEGMANDSGCEDAGGEDECTGGLPCKRSVAEMDSPCTGGALDPMVESETRRQSVPRGGSSGGGGGTNGDGDNGGGTNGGKGGREKEERTIRPTMATVKLEKLPGRWVGVGGALDPMVESEPRRRSVPGSSDDVDNGGDSGGGNCDEEGDGVNGGGNGSGICSGIGSDNGSGNGSGNDSSNSSWIGSGDDDGGGGGDGINGGGDSSGDGGSNGSGNGSGDGSGNGGGIDSGNGSGESDRGGGIRRSARRRTPSCRRFSSDSISSSPPPPPATGSARRPSQPCPSVRVPQSSPTSVRRGIRTACGKNVCGDTTGWEDPCELCDQKPSHVGHLLCSACHGSPLLKAESKPIWMHITKLANIERAVRLWEAHLAATMPWLETIVKPGFKPTTSCLCSRSGCFFATVRRLDCAEQRELAPKCVACATKKSPQWRTTCSELGLFQRWLSTGESRGKCVRESGTILEADSTICNACWAEFRDKGKSWVKTHGPGFTVKTFLLYLRQGRQPRRDEGHELSVFLTQQAMLGILETGQAVCLEDGIEMLVKQRANAKLREVKRSRLVSQTLEMFYHLSDTVTDAFYVCYDGDVVGDDNRTRAQFLMPERFDFLYVAKLLRGEKRLEGEVSRLRDSVAYSEQAIARRL